jgi:hypothetical protein
METLAFALEYVQRGHSVIPLKPGTKIPPSFIEVYRGIKDNRIEVFPSICSQIRYNYLKDSTDINTQCTIIVGHKTGGASIMPSLPSLPSPTNNTSYLSPVDSSNLEPEEKIKFTPDYHAKEPAFWRVIGVIK